MTQVINQITLLTVILTGAALIREREQGTVEHLLVMPVVPSEIMLAKMIANGLVILVAAMLSLQFVVHWWIGSPINGSLLLFLFGAAIYALVVAALGIMLGTLATTMGQFGLLAMPVLIVTQLLSGSSTPMESMPVWLQYFIDNQPDAAFRRFRPGGAVPRRRHHAPMAAARGDVRDRRCLFHHRQRPLPQGDLRRLISLRSRHLAIQRIKGPRSQKRCARELCEGDCQPSCDVLEWRSACRHIASAHARDGGGKYGFGKEERRLRRAGGVGRDLWDPRAGRSHGYVHVDDHE